MSRGRAKRDVDHAPVKDLTVSEYQAALELVIAGKNQAEVCRLVFITGTQFWHMWRTGFPSRSKKPDLPSFEAVIAEQSVALRRAGQEAAISVGIRGVRVLDKQVANAEVANDIGDMLLRVQRDKIAEWMAKPTETRGKLSEVMLGEEIQSLLRTVRPWADLTRPAAAFDKLYDMHVTEQWAHRGDPHVPMGTIDAEARERLPAAVSSREEIVGGDSGKSYQLVEAAKTFEGWTQEEIDHFAETGEEPADKG